LSYKVILTSEVNTYHDANNAAQDCSFLSPKIFFEWVTRKRGAKYRWDKLKLAIFDHRLAVS